LCGSALPDHADGGLEGQALGLEEGRGHALAVADDGGEHDGAVDLDIGAWTLTRRGLCIGEDLGEIGIVSGERTRRGRRGLLAKEARDVIAQATEIDRIGDEHPRRIGILGEGQQQVLKRDHAMGLAGGIVARARERRHERFGACHPRPPTPPRSLVRRLRPITPWMRADQPFNCLEHDSRAAGIRHCRQPARKSPKASWS
jgi:hypothetical protein